MVHELGTVFLSQKTIEIDNPSFFSWKYVLEDIHEEAKLTKSSQLLKINLVKSTKNKLYFNLVYLDGVKLSLENTFEPLLNSEINIKETNEITCLIVPAGIGAKIGGYAGDANPVVRMLAPFSKYLLTHPNVVNGAVLSDLPPNLIYLEGFFLDHFLLGRINIVPRNQNRIGVIFDRGIDEKRLLYEVNVLNALRSFYGIDISFWTVTSKPLNVKPDTDKFGFSSGEVENLDSLLDKAFKLKELGVTAIAVCSVIPDYELNIDYVQGNAVDPIGGVESIISHIVSGVTGLVSANAPVLKGSIFPDYDVISPVAASEYIADTFLPSVISGLRYAPEIRAPSSELRAQVFKPEIQSLQVADRISELGFYNLSKIIVPYNGFGSSGVLFLNNLFKDKVLFVCENVTALDVNPEHINAQFNYVNKYIDLIPKDRISELQIDPSVLNRPLSKITQI